MVVGWLCNLPACFSKIYHQPLKYNENRGDILPFCYRFCHFLIQICKWLLTSLAVESNWKLCHILIDSTAKDVYMSFTCLYLKMAESIAEWQYFSSVFLYSSGWWKIQPMITFHHWYCKALVRLNQMEEDKWSATHFMLHLLGFTVSWDVMWKKRKDLNFISVISSFHARFSRKCKILVKYNIYAMGMDVGTFVAQ